MVDEPKRDTAQEAIPEEDLEALKLSQAEWDDIADDEVEPDEDAEALLEATLGGDLEIDEEEEVIEEDDDNPYQESDEALPDDKEEAAIARMLREDE